MRDNIRGDFLNCFVFLAKCITVCLPACCCPLTSRGEREGEEQEQDMKVQGWEEGWEIKAASEGKEKNSERRERQG